MPVNSLEFLGFFIAVAAVFFSIPSKIRWMFLLGASYFFYAWFSWKYLILMIISSGMTYSAALWLDRTRTIGKRRVILISAVSLSLGCLAGFKYLDFIVQSISYLKVFSPENIPSTQLISWIMPLGISFHTFQVISYLLDVYHRRITAQTNAGLLGLYLCFYGTIVSGPIERAGNFIPQTLRKADFDYDRVVSGLHLMLWGFVKKIVIADRLGIAVDAVYDRPEIFSGPVLLLATVFYAYQVYCDFSGYSDIVIGSTRVLGINLTLNFNNPYHANSISDFWKRWHISLSNWLRDYLFLPISFRILRVVQQDRILGIKIESWSYVLSMLITMTLSGLWHGANYTFLIWGFLHGFFMAFSHVTRKIRKKITRKVFSGNMKTLHEGLRIVITFGLLCFSFVFFRAASVTDAVVIVRRMLDGMIPFASHWSDVDYLRNLLGGFGMDRYDLLFCCTSICALEFIQWIVSKERIQAVFARLPVWKQSVVYHFELVVLLLFGSFNSGQTFIYFQF